MNKLILTPVGPRTWELVEEFTVSIDEKTFKVPKGFLTDLASVPRILWILIPPFGKYTKAAVIHDYLCYKSIISRKEGDKVFYKIMIRDGTKKWKAKIMYLGVRLYSWVKYNKSFE